ncbi:MAG: helix-turn-helix domain-containing protein [Evtepia gabavorous]
MREELSENPWHCCTFLMVEWKNGGFALTFSPMVCYDASVLQGTSNQRMCERMENKKSFGTFICQRRKELGMTQKEFAQRLFVTDSAVSKWERGVSQS